MAKSINKVTLFGRIGKELEIRYSQSGTAVLGFTLATSSSYKDGSGVWQEKTEWNNCVAFGKVAEIIEKYCGKGDRLYVEGRLQTDKYEKEGETKYTTKVVVNEVTLIEGKKDNTQGESDTPQPDSGDDDELPF